MGLKVSTRIVGGFSAQRMQRARQAVERKIPEALTRIARDAEKQLKTDYLQRGGTFTRKKADGWKWVKNPTKWLRVGTGALRRSWRHVAAIKIIGGWQAKIESRGVPYARIHEEGGWTGKNKRTWIRERKYLKPMMDDNMAKWRRWLGEDLRAIFR